MSDLLDIVRQAIDEWFDLSDENSQANHVFAAIQENGYRIVPTQPTVRMLQAALDNWRAKPGLVITGREYEAAHEAWLIMLLESPLVVPASITNQNASSPDL